MVDGEAQEENSGSRRPGFLSSVLQTWGTNIAIAVLSLVNVLIVSRTLGPSGRGDVAFLTAIAWFTSNLFTIGIQEANANLAGSKPHLRSALASNSVVLSFLFGGIAFVMLTTFVWLVPAAGGESSDALRWVTFASLPLLILSIYLRFLVQADYGFLVTNIAWVVTPIANVTVNGLLAAVGLLTVATAVGTWICGQILGALILVWYVWRRSQGFGRVDAEAIRWSLGFGVRSHVGRVLLLGNYRLDQWILGAVAGSRELGLYSVAVAWAEGLWFLPTALAAVQRPDLVRAPGPEARRQAALVFRAALIVTSLFMVGLIVLAPFLCATIFGSDFAGATNDLRVLAAGAFGIVAMKQLGSALTAQRKPTLASVAIGLAFVSTVVLDILLIPRFGGLGAAIASTVSYTVGGIAVAAIFARSLGGRASEFVPRGTEVGMMWRRLRRRGGVATASVQASDSGGA
jgi:O-antigen/teichoic acid export membrane protein